MTRPGKEIEWLDRHDAPRSRDEGLQICGKGFGIAGQIDHVADTLKTIEKGN